MRLLKHVPAISTKIRWCLWIYCPPDTLLDEGIGRLEKLFGVTSSLVAGAWVLSHISKPVDPFGTIRLYIPFSTMPFSIFCARASSMTRRARYSWNLYDNQDQASRIANAEASRMSTPTTMKGAKMMASETELRTAESCSEAISTTAFGEARGCVKIDLMFGSG